MTLTGFKDKFERDIKVGDTVVYPVRRGSSTFLNAAKITGHLDNYLTAEKLPHGPSVKLRVPDRCAIVEV